MFGEIVWTERSEAHIARHGVTPDEVEETIYTRPTLVAAGRQGTTEIYGTTDAGRHLVVIVAESIAAGIYVVTARPMTVAERKTFKRKAR